jgi:hypothetical protein
MNTFVDEYVKRMLLIVMILILIGFVVTPALLALSTGSLWWLALYIVILPVFGAN